MSAFGSLFSNRYLSSSNGVPGVFFDIYTALLIVGLLASIFVYLRRRPLSRGVTPRRHLLRRIAQAGMYIFTFGLFFALMRYLQVDYVDMRFWSYLVILGAFAYGGYLTYYLSERYSLAMFQFENHEAGRRYRTTSKRKPVAVPAAAPKPAMQRGKRRRS